MKEPGPDPIRAHFARSLETLTRAVADAPLLAAIETVAEVVVRALRDGHKVLLAGNGGSAADAQHFAAELVGRYRVERAGLPAIALTTDSSALTALANDYGIEAMFARQIEAIGRAGDVFIGLSTSGRSPNILAALKTARARDLVTVGMTGAKGVAMGTSCNHLIVAPSEETALIQQIHEVAGHALCDAVERAFAGPAATP